MQDMKYSVEIIKGAEKLKNNLKSFDSKFESKKVFFGKLTCHYKSNMVYNNIENDMI